MKSGLLLKIAAILIFIHLLGHSAGHMGWKHPKDPKMQEVVNTMLDYKAPFMGASRSMGDYFHGYSLTLFFVFGMSICILWLLAGFAEEQPLIAKKIGYPLGIAYLGIGIIEAVYFFPFAAGISLLAGLMIIIALMRLPAISK
jgi:hypothetical protein